MASPDARSHPMDFDDRVVTRTFSSASNLAGNGLLKLRISNGICLRTGYRGQISLFGHPLDLIEQLYQVKCGLCKLNYLAFQLRSLVIPGKFDAYRFELLVFVCHHSKLDSRVVDMVGLFDGFRRPLARPLPVVA